MQSTTGILLIHGFTDSPATYDWLAPELANAGFEVHTPTLSGHDSYPDALRKVRYNDWITEAEQALLDLKSRCAHVFVVGFSLGGVISLLLAARHNITGVISMSAPYGISLFKRIFAFTFARFMPYQFKRYGPDIKNRQALMHMRSYNFYPTVISLQIFKLVGLLQKTLQHINVPVLILHGRDDHAVPVENARKIYDTVQIKHKKIRIFENSFHILPMDFDRHLVRDEIIAFIKQHPPVDEASAKLKIQ